MGTKKLSPKAQEALKHIRNAVMHFGKVPSIRQLMSSLSYKSPRSAALIVKELEKSGFLQKKADGAIRLIKDLESDEITRTVTIPLVGTAPCGAPMTAEQNIEAMVPVSTKLAHPGSKYFLLHAIGTSMNKANINNGDIVLVRQQPTAEDGQIVVAVIEDEATIKQYYRKGNLVVLKPNSSDPEHQPIVLTNDFKIQGVVVATMPNFKQHD